MKFTTIVATILSMAAFAIAAPIAGNGKVSISQSQGCALTNIFTIEVDARQNHGMCVKNTDGTVEQIADC